MLAFNKEVTSERTEDELKKLQQDVCNTIKQIEISTREDDFPRNQCGLCPYCGYQAYCPSFKHQIKLTQKTIEQFKKDDGVKLVDGYAEIKVKLDELQEKEEEFKTKLVDFSKQLGIDIVYGSNMLAKVKEFEKIILPEDKEELIAIMKDKGEWEELAMINFMKFQSKYFKGELHPDIHKKITKEKDFRVSLSKRKDLEEE
jgi:hypothetical protein